MVIAGIHAPVVMVLQIDAANTRFCMADQPSYFVCVHLRFLCRLQILKIAMQGVFHQSVPQSLLFGLSEYAGYAQVVFLQ